MMQFYIDIEDASANKLGSGPILSANSWSVKRLMDKAGEWSFTAPLTDVNMAQATPRRYAHIYAYLNGAYTWVGGGPIDSIATSIGPDGVAMATVSGSDLVRELAWRSVGFLTLDNGAGVPISHADAVAAVAGFAPAGWTFNADASPGSNYLYGQFNGESVLSALSTVANRSRSHFYLSGKRVLTFTSSFVDAGIQAVQGRNTMSSATTAISSLALEQSSFDLYSRIIPYGAGQGYAALTLRPTSRSAATGYTLNKTSNYLKRDATETAYGRCEQTVTFRDIGPISNTTADVISAANALFDAAEYWLQKHSVPVTSYKVSVTECPVLLLPMQSIRITYRDLAAGININSDLMVLGVEWTGDVDGVRTAGLTVADSGQWPESDVQAIVDSIASGQVYQAIPQLNANAYVVPFTKNLDDVQANPAEFRFRFDNEVTQLSRVCFDFQLLALESTVKTVGASTVSAVASGDHTHSVTIAGHTHDVTLSNHTHSTPDHHHHIRITGGSAPTYPVGFSAAGTSGGFVHNASGSNFDYPTNDDEGGSTSGNGGGTTATSSNNGTIVPTSATGGNHTHSVTPTITTTYGVYRDTSGTFVVADLEYSLDGSTWYIFTTGINSYESLGDGWHRVDLTALLQDSTTLRPLSANNKLQIRRQGAAALRRATIDAQLSIRTIIQATALV